MRLGLWKQQFHRDQLDTLPTLPRACPSEARISEAELQCQQEPMNVWRRAKGLFALVSGEKA